MSFIFKLFGWFFSNLLLIIIVVAACYAFVYWDDPFGKDTPAGKVMAAFPEETETVKSLIGKLMIEDDSKNDGNETVVVESSTVSTAQVESDAADSGAADVDPMTGVATPETAQEDAAEVAQAQEPELVSEVSSSAASDGPVDLASGMAIEPDQRMQIDQNADQSNFVSPEIEQQLSQIKQDGSSIAPVPEVANEPDTEAAAPVMSAAPAASEPASNTTGASLDAEDQQARELMIDARKAYYRRDYDACVAAYEKLISIQKDNYDALGELGNVYFNQGDMQKAADAYYQAATIMVAQGQGRRAASLVGFLRTVDEEKAAQLRKSIEQGQEPPESL